MRLQVLHERRERGARQQLLRVRRQRPGRQHDRRFRPGTGKVRLCVGATGRAATTGPAPAECRRSGAGAGLRRSASTSSVRAPSCENDDGEVRRDVAAALRPPSGLATTSALRPCSRVVPADQELRAKRAHLFRARMERRERGHQLLRRLGALGLELGRQQREVVLLGEREAHVVVGDEAQLHGGLAEAHADRRAAARGRARSRRA